MHDDSVSCKADGGLVSMGRLSNSLLHNYRDVPVLAAKSLCFYAWASYVYGIMSWEDTGANTCIHKQTHTHTHLFSNTGRNLVWEHSCHYVKKDAQWGKGRWKNDGDRWEEGGSKWCMRSCDQFNLEYGIMRGERKEACIWNAYFKSEGEQG